MKQDVPVKERTSFDNLNATRVIVTTFGVVLGTSDPDRIQNTSMFLVFGSAILNIFVFIAGFGHDLRRMELVG